MAECELIRLDGALASLPAAEGFLHVQRCSEAVSSAALEGQSSSLAGLASTQSQQGSEAVSLARRCMLAAEAGLPGGRTIEMSAERLESVYATLAPSRSTMGADSAAGALGMRPLAEKIRAAVSGGSEEGPAARLCRALGAVESFAPLGDASGRMARCLVAALGAHAGIPATAALCWSRVLSGRAEPYRCAVRSLHNDESGDWLEFAAEMLTQGAVASQRSIREFGALREAHRAAVAEKLGHAVGRGLRVLDALAQRPLATVAEVGAITGTTYVAANQLVARFVRLGILRERTGQRRNREFEYQPYLAIFGGSAVSVPEATETRARRKRRMPQRSVRPRRMPDAPPPKPARRAPKPVELSDHLL